MMYQFRDKKQISRRKSAVRNIFIVGIFLALSLFGVLAWSGKLWNSVARPIWSVENAIVDTINSEGYIIRTKASVFSENDKLKKENENLKLSMLDYQILKDENTNLKDLLSRLPVNHNFILATILTKPNRSPYDTVFIDIGASQGITEGMQVFASGNIPVGEVSKVYTNDSLVMLYSNPGQTTGGVLEGSNASVELVGRGGGNFEMTVPLDLPSENGMKVTLPSINNEILAIIDAVISSPTDPIKKVILHSPVNIQNLKWLQVKKD